MAGQPPPDRRLASLIRVFAPLGWRAIGGPAVHMALMEREVVRRRAWLSREDFRRLFAACNLLPGPGSTQLALLLGLRRAGLAGMLVSAVCFVGPAVLVMLALGELYSHYGAAAQVQRVLLGVDAVVVAMVARAALDLATLGSRRLRSWLAAGAALAAGLAGVDPALVFVGAGVAGVLLARSSATLSEPGGTLAALTLPWPAASGLAGAGLLPLAVTFLKVGTLAFGSGYVLLPFLHAELVGGRFGLGDHQLADAFAISQATPGPVFAIAAFLGVQIAGIAGGLVAAGAVFLPSLALVPLAGALVRGTQRHRALRLGLDLAGVAALGLIGAAAVQLARTALRGPVEIAAAALVLLLLWRHPSGQLAGLAVGLAAGALLWLTGW